MGNTILILRFGTWKTHLRRLVHPLTNSTNWVEHDGTTVVRRIWNGRANLLELEADGPGALRTVCASEQRFFEKNRAYRRLNGARSDLLPDAENETTR